MTLPSERSFAVHNTQQFLYDLLFPKKTPKVPKAIRERARRLLRHYPSSYWIDTCSKSSPDVFGPIKLKLDHVVEWEKLADERRQKV